LSASSWRAFLPRAIACVMVAMESDGDDDEQ
jgi:hypothetical protein